MSKNTTQKRKQLISLIEKKEKFIKEYSQYGGPGLMMKFKRLLKYKHKYLGYAFARLTPRRLKLKTFYGKDFWVFLSGNPPLHFWGILGDESEVRLTKFFIKNLTEDTIFYDIGAFCGYYSLLATEIIKNGEIHAFEPISSSFKCLERNLSRFNNVFLNQVVVSHREGEIDFFDGSHERNPEGSSLVKPFNVSDNQFKKIKVRTITLDRYCSNHSKPTFIKIDVEGAEEFVIKGGLKILRETNPVISIEIWQEALPSHFKAIEILYNLGYKSFSINNQGELVYIERIVPQKYIVGSGDNFIFKK